MGVDAEILSISAVRKVGKRACHYIVDWFIWLIQAI